LFVLEALGGIVKAILATALLVGFSSFTAAHAEREILDPGTAVAKVVTAHRPSVATEIMWPAPSIVVSTVSTKKEDALSSTAIAAPVRPAAAPMPAIVAARSAGSTVVRWRTLIDDECIGNRSKRCPP
jgi:hypothetical protein